ncbi:Gfo/Idh/MocA family oxidoreductase [Opitutales bacterium]|jgi:glucose-fructose oxidoreductase|nr:Gfo/Idh/MocA family oxidoreductase [Opitutales bacterium]
MQKSTDSISHLPGSSRRTFLKSTSVSVAGAALLPLLFQVPLTAAHHAGTKPMGIALVGLGNYAMKQLAPALQQTKNCKLAGLVSGTPEKKEKYGKQYSISDENIYSYETFDQIADNKDIDIVYVVLPNSMHKEYVIRASKAGKHVISEKPLGINAAECEDMIRVCKENGVSLNVGYRLHFDPNHQEIIRMAKEKPFGDVTYVHSEFSFPIGDPTQWRLRKALAGGGAVYDIGVYCIQAARYATGEEPIAITAQEYKTDFDKFAEVDETVTFQLEFPSGVISNSTTSYNARANRLFVSYRNRGTALIEPAYSYGGIKGSVNGKLMGYEPVNQQAKHMDAVSKSILEGTDSTVSGQEGLLDMKVVDALYKSLASGGARTEIG